MPRLISLNLPALTALRAATRSILRNLPLFLAPRPRTPLRVLCIIAFDTLHILRHTRPLSTQKRQTLAALLDFGASANAALDRKSPASADVRTIRLLVDSAGLHTTLADYARRLTSLESRRPSPGGDPSRFHAIRAYRESVVRLSLAMLALTANLHTSLDAAIHATSANPAMNLLFRIVMLCQIIDDLVDYPLDFAARLPTFLTACSPLHQSLSLTHHAARAYADRQTLTARTELFPFRLALSLVSACTSLSIIHARWRAAFHRHTAIPAAENPMVAISVHPSPPGSENAYPLPS